MCEETGGMSGKVDGGWRCGGGVCEKEDIWMRGGGKGQRTMAVMGRRSAWWQRIEHFLQNVDEMLPRAEAGASPVDECKKLNRDAVQHTSQSFDVRRLLGCGLRPGSYDLSVIVGSSLVPRRH